MVDPLTALVWAAVIGVVLGFLFWPRSGFFWNYRRIRRLTGRVVIEDALKHLFNFEYRSQAATVESLAGALEMSQNATADIVVRAESLGVIQSEDGTLQLTPNGRAYALRVIRVHRLWEHHLAEETGVTEQEWHRLAEDREHDLADMDADRLAEDMGNPAFDPHGDPIPTSAGEIAPQTGYPLTGLVVGSPATIVHIEDEPEAVYAQLVAEGLQPGTRVEVIESNKERVQFWANGGEHVLAPIIAANVSVVKAPEKKSESDEAYEPLSALSIGESGRVVLISRRARGLERRRLLDLGILPGTVIEAEMKSPSGDPTAYKIRGATIALRREQADQIRIERILEAKG